jgi:preprotein translocase subunit YajC
MQFLNDLLSVFVSNAYAADASPPAGGGFSLVIMTGIFILFMYFVMWRPQAKRAKDHRMLINSLVKEDEVLTSGGILGKVAKINDNYILLTLAENIAITVQKSSIVSALPKGTLKSIA